jgi:SpoVK/Ycf46/Vps4 family AAA+-type ATPase
MLSYISNQQLGREETSQEIKQILTNYAEKIKDVNFKKGIYIYGSPGSGKSFFIQQILTEMNYDSIIYNAGDVRNKTLINNIASNNISTKNVLKMMYKQKQNIAIVMDEIDVMNNGDKGSIISLIKLIRQKKTKNQRTENQTLNPIICIGNYYMDKKIKELMKVCHVFEMKTPTPEQISTILHEKMVISASLEKKLQLYIQGDLRKLNFVCKLYQTRREYFTNNGKLFCNMFITKVNIDDSKKITHSLLHRYIPFSSHGETMNETDRTIVALLWHENIIDLLQCIKPSFVEKTWRVYLQILEKICFADYIDRITFQNQIWQFNEMSSLIKTFYSNKIFHDFLSWENIIPPPLKDIRFTKILTKYSTEFNNITFINNLCNKLEMDKKDLLCMFQEYRLKYVMPPGRTGTKSASTQTAEMDVFRVLEEKMGHLDIHHLDMKRMYRYLDKNVKNESTIPILEDLELLEKISDEEEFEDA